MVKKMDKLNTAVERELCSKYEFMISHGTCCTKAMSKVKGGSL